MSAYTISAWHCFTWQLQVIWWFFFSGPSCLCVFLKALGHFEAVAARIGWSSASSSSSSSQLSLMRTFSRTRKALQFQRLPKSIVWYCLQHSATLHYFAFEMQPPDGLKMSQAWATECCLIHEMQWNAMKTKLYKAIWSSHHLSSSKALVAFPIGGFKSCSFMLNLNFARGLASWQYLATTNGSCPFWCFFWNNLKSEVSWSLCTDAIWCMCKEVKSFSPVSKLHCRQCLHM